VYDFMSWFKYYILDSVLKSMNILFVLLLVLTIFSFFLGFQFELQFEMFLLLLMKSSQHNSTYGRVVLFTG